MRYIQYCSADTLIMYPPETDCIIGWVESATFEGKGGSYHSHEHGVTVTVPSGAIPVGVKAEMKLAATLTAAVQQPDNTKPVSAMVWLCMDVTPQKPIILQIPHYVKIKSEAHAKNLRFVKATFLTSNNKTIKTMEAIEGGNFPVGETYGVIAISHFCYYCIEFYEAKGDIPHYSYRVVTMKEQQPNLAKKLWLIDVCVIPSLPTCLKVSILCICIY